MDCAYVPAATRSIRSVITLTVVLVVISALMLESRDRHLQSFEVSV